MIDREDLRAGSPFSALFHKAWGQAKESPEYNKQVWKDLEEKIWSRGGKTSLLEVMLGTLEPTAGPDPDSDDPAERAKLRPDDYPQLPAAKQWAIDKHLGLLDWDGA